MLLNFFQCIGLIKRTAQSWPRQVELYRLEADAAARLGKLKQQVEAKKLEARHRTLAQACLAMVSQLWSDLCLWKGRQDGGGGGRGCGA
jgi:hypothetical protein